MVLPHYWTMLCQCGPQEQRHSIYIAYTLSKCLGSVLVSGSLACTDALADWPQCNFPNREKQDFDGRRVLGIVMRPPFSP